MLLLSIKEYPYKKDQLNFSQKKLSWSRILHINANGKGTMS